MNNIGYLLMKVSKDLRYRLGMELEGYGVTPSQWAVLKELDMQSDKTILERTAVVMGDKLGFDKPTMSGIVKRLVEKELLEKRQHPEDKRAFVLFLTETAQRLIPVLEKVSNEVMEEALSVLSEGEQIQCVQILQKLNERLNEV